MGDDKELLDNRDLFNMIRDIEKEMSDTREELNQTRQEIRKYNGLRSDLSEVMDQQKQIWDELTCIRDTESGKELMKERLIKYGGWVVGVLGLLAKLGVIG